MSTRENIRLIARAPSLYLITGYRDSNIKQSNAFIFTTKIACHNAHILKIYHRQEFKHALCWYFCQAHFVQFVLKPK